MAWSWEETLEHPPGCGELAALARLAGTGRTCMSKGGGPPSRRQSHLWLSRCLSFPGLVRTGVPGVGTAAVPDVPEGHWLFQVGAVGGRARWGGWGLWVPRVSVGVPAHSGDVGPEPWWLCGAGMGTCLGTGQ